MKINFGVKSNDDLQQNVIKLAFLVNARPIFLRFFGTFFNFSKKSIRVSVLRKSKVGGASPLIFFKFCMNLRKYVFEKYVKYDDRRASELSRSAW